MHYILEQISTVIDVRKEGGVNTIFGAPRTITPKLEEIIVDDLMNFCNYIDKDMVEVNILQIALQTEKFCAELKSKYHQRLL